LRRQRRNSSQSSTNGKQELATKTTADAAYQDETGRIKEKGRRRGKKEKNRNSYSTTGKTGTVNL
jgi:hypothetical protein